MVFRDGTLLLSRGSTSRLKRLTVAVGGIGIGEEKILKPLNCGAAWTLTSLALVGDGFKSAEDANDAVASSSLSPRAIKLLLVAPATVAKTKRSFDKIFLVLFPLDISRRAAADGTATWKST